jgi:hypothetical protein
MATQRGNASNRVRNQAGAAIFRCTDAEFMNSALQFKELIGWTENEDGSGGYKVLAPILFKDYQGKVDKWKIFRNPIILRVSHRLGIVILFFTYFLLPDICRFADWTICGQEGSWRCNLCS